MSKITAKEALELAKTKDRRQQEKALDQCYESIKESAMNGFESVSIQVPVSVSSYCKEALEMDKYKVIVANTSMSISWKDAK